ncbi:hypothetical protein JD844_015309 [Phrynosoma platyrhinos]|uniref:Transmembrane protein 8B n=1 Tax=Phrynosoma platyrhinos TaxID=52577 RepID=A0ABQ7SIX7_PHRPL|nr:hypothetical protein JD844_015309 [Phrynosoma platyrhinos]
MATSKHPHSNRRLAYCPSNQLGSRGASAQSILVKGKGKGWRPVSLGPWTHGASPHISTQAAPSLPGEVRRSPSVPPSERASRCPLAPLPGMAPGLTLSALWTNGQAPHRIGASLPCNSSSSSNGPGGKGQAGPWGLCGATGALEEPASWPKAPQYFRSGAPPVINPLRTHFPRETAVPGSFTLTLTWTLPNRTTGVFNITSPLPGDWFLAAHLPKEQGKISVKVRNPLSVIAGRVFVPSYTSRVLVQLRGCQGAGQGREGCPLWLKLRGKAPPLHNSTAVDCRRERSPCRLRLELPFWQNWYYLLVERAPGSPTAGNLSFQLGVQLKDCSQVGLSRPLFQLPGSNMPRSFGSAGGLASADILPPSPPNGTQHPSPPSSSPASGERCWPIRPTLRNELDTFSVHFYIFFGPNVSVPPDRPAIFAIHLLPVLDSGGILNLELRLNTVRLLTGWPGGRGDSVGLGWSGLGGHGQVLYLLGAMLLSMALQLDRHGLWNLLGPSLFALGIMAIAWTARSIRRRHCYPPTWQRWLFYLLPGALIAASAVLLYAFVETEENYFYIHSIWHMLIAGSVGFLLPPQAKPDATGGLAGALPRRKGCGYQLCINEQEELGLVDPGAGVSVTSVCTS